MNTPIEFLKLASFNLPILECSF